MSGRKATSNLSRLLALSAGNVLLTAQKWGTRKIKNRAKTSQLQDEWPERAHWGVEGSTRKKH
jgi:hypothetical protein